MSTGINKNGGVVNVGDHVSIVAKVVSYTGSGSTASVTVQSPLDKSTYVIQANDCFAQTHLADTSHTAVSLQGRWYGVAGDDVTVLGVVTAISGSGINAVLSVQLISSLTTITTAAGNCSSDNV
jgi:hypothetical protein